MPELGLGKTGPTSKGSFPEGPLEPGGTAAASSELEKRLGVLCHLRMSPCQDDTCSPEASCGQMEIAGDSRLL